MKLENLKQTLNDLVELGDLEIELKIYYKPKGKRKSKTGIKVLKSLLELLPHAGNVKDIAINLVKH